MDEPRHRYRDGVRALAPLVPGVLAFGASFGLLAESAGMSVAATAVMSATTFAGSAQIAAASLLEQGAGAAAAIVAAVLLNARYAPMSVAVASIFPGSRARRFAESQLIVDESWAIAGRTGRFDYHVLAGAGAFLWCFWVGGTLVGRLAGESLGDPRDIGLDAAFAALFLALMLPYLRDRRSVTAALLGAAITFVLIPVAPAGVPLIAASAACLLGLRR